MIGNIGSYTGTQASALGSAEPTFRSWQDWVNAHGGLSGHPVKVIIDDDGGDTSKAITDAQELVQQDHVSAVVGDFTSADSQIVSYLAQNKVPYIGGLNLESVQDSPDYFPTGGSQEALVYASIKAAVAAGSKKLALPYCSEVASCSAKVPTYTTLGRASGLPVVWSGQFSQSAPSFTAQCLAAKDAGADTIFIVSAPDAAIQVAQDCTQLGYDPREIGVDGTLSAAMLPIPQFQGYLSGQSNPDPALTSTPGLQAMHTAIDKYAPGTAYVSATIAAWASAQLFADAYKAAGSPTSPSGDDVLTGLYALKGDTLDGLAPPLTFNKDKPTLIGCAFVVGIAKHTYSAPVGLTQECLPSS